MAEQGGSHSGVPPPPPGMPPSSIPPPPPGFPPQGAQGGHASIPPPPILQGNYPNYPPPPPGFNFPPPSSAMQQIMGIAPLPMGWTEHLSPTNVPYYRNEALNVSTYVRPDHSIPPPPIPAAKKKKEKADKKSKTVIPNTDDNWVRVKTNEGRTFYMDLRIKKSFWEVPDDIKGEVEALEKSEKAAAEAEAAAAAAAETARLKAEMATPSSSNNKRKSEAPVPQQQPPAKQQRVSPPPPPPAPPAAEDEEDEGIVGPDDEMDEEAWQRAVAAEMAIEYVSPAEEKQRAKEAKEKEARELQEREEEARRAVFQAPQGGQGVQLSVDEGKALFKALLQEKRISPVAPWDTSLPLFINDPRYILLSSLADRKAVFDEYCRETARNARLAKINNTSTAQDGLSTSSDPKTVYEALLHSEVTSTRTRFDDFKKKFKKDRRFFGFGKDDREREKVFKTFLRELGEKKRVEKERNEKAFEDLLKESGAKEGVEWKTFKRGIEDDPRYDAVGSSSLREEIYLAYLKSLSRHSAPTSASVSAASKPVPAPESTSKTPLDKKARAEQSLREREEKVRMEKRRVENEIGRSRQAVGREESEAILEGMLVDIVRDHLGKWSDILPQLENDQRYSNVSLSLSAKHQLFEKHQTKLYTKRLNAVHGIFQSNAPDLNTTFDQIYSKIVDDFALKRMEWSIEETERAYDAWLRQRRVEARQEFEDLLKENGFVEFWGRMKKENEGKDEEETDNKDEDSEDDEGEEGGGKANIKSMASKIDLKEIHDVLKYDRRYRQWDFKGEERMQWIKDHLKSIEAPKLSVHT